MLTLVGDHVDILGRSSLNDLILRVAGGKGDQIEDNYVSNIRDYSEKVRIYEEEGSIKSEIKDHLGL
jgi:phospholipid:diacylglycerol acyltransferase